MNRRGVRKTRVVRRRATGRYSGGSFGRWLRKAAKNVFRTVKKAGRFAIKNKLLSKLMLAHPSTKEYAPIASMVGLGKKSCGHKCKCKCKSGQGLRLAGQGRISMVTNKRRGRGLRT